MRVFGKVEYIRLADCIAKAQMTAGRDINKNMHSMTDAQVITAWHNLMARIVDMLTLDSDLFDAAKFKERALID